MSKALQTTFFVHAIVALILGVPLLILPGTFLGSIGWVTVDVLISRLLGAALLAMAWGSFRGWRATERTQIRILLELEAVFTVLGSIGILRHLLITPTC
jgi:membrane protein DedA with SNARE-associated domain